MSSWRTVPLGDVVQFSSGGTPSRKTPEYFQGDIPWITGADIDASGAVVARARITSEAVRESATTIVPAGTVLLVTRTSVGKVGEAAFDVAFSQDVTALRPIDDRLRADYLRHFLRARQSVLSSQARGATIKGVTREVVEGLEIPLPPLQEQRRIAVILDQGNALRAKRREAITQLNTLSQSIFLDMFGDPVENPRGWRLVELGDVVTRVTDGEHKTPQRQAEGVPLLSARNVQDGWIDFSTADHVSVETFAELCRRIEPKSNDILISCSGTIGRVARVRESTRFAMVRSAALVRPSREVVPEFLEHMLRSPGLRKLMTLRANSSAQANLFQNQIRALPVILPPRERQEVFASLAEKVAAGMGVCARAAEASESLNLSLRDRAFKGEL